jgi:phosphohistidine phosphatase
MSKAFKRSQDGPIRQACAVPYRWRGGELEFCLVTSSRKGRWGFPKGIVDPGESLRQTAIKEAREEAGLRGRVEGRLLGHYTYSKWGCTLTVAAYLMRVVHESETWEEARWRQRRWFRPGKARAKIGRQGQAELLQTALDRLAPPMRQPARQANHRPPKRLRA